jgi:hypothetical protein
MAEWRMKGEYLKNCSCVPGCPCDTHGYPGPNEFCESAIGMNITEGNFDGTDLSGLHWIVVVHWPKALHDGNGTADVYIDERADDGQREALGKILSGQAGGPIFEILSTIITTVHGPHYVPIEWEFDKGARRARMAAPGRIETTSEPMIVPGAPDQPEQRVIVQIPDGFEYKESEVAQTEMLSSSGEVKFDWKGTHSSLAHVEHTHEALVA